MNSKMNSNSKSNSNSNRRGVLPRSPSRTKKRKRSGMDLVQQEYCSLGLRKILGDTSSTSNSLAPPGKPPPQKQEQDEDAPLQLGPMIRLCRDMHLGRTPPRLLQAMQRLKPLDDHWTPGDFAALDRRHGPLVRKHALLGIVRHPGLSKRADDLLLSISRTLLTVVAATETSLTLQRCPQVLASNGKPAKQIDVLVHRNSNSVEDEPQNENENENSNSSNSTSNTNPNSNTNSKSHSKDSANNTVRVLPNARVVLREGDTLTILNHQYRFKVVKDITAAAAAPPAASNMIDLTGSSSNSSGSSSGGNSSSDSELRAVALGRSRRTGRSSFGGRESLSSMADRTVALRNNSDNDHDNDHDNSNDDADAAFEADTRIALRRSLEATHNDQEIIEIKSSSSGSLEEEDRKPKSRPAQAATSFPDKLDAAPEIINLASSLSSSDSGESSRKNNNTRAKTNQAHATPTKTKPSTDKLETTPEIINLAESLSSSGSSENNNSEETNRNNKMTNTADSIDTEKRKAVDDTAKPVHDDGLRSRLRQSGKRIKTVLLQEQSPKGTVRERPLRELIRKKKTNIPNELVKREPEEAAHGEDTSIGPMGSLESPTKRFWDPVWSGDAATEDSSLDGAPLRIVTPNSTTNATKHNTSSSPPKEVASPLPPPNDMQPSTANFYWNALNSGRPRVGAWYLNVMMMAANTVPSPLLCQKWMALLTWGPKLLTTTAPKDSKHKITKSQFSWDGPRMEFALELWKKALRLHPGILLPRMIAQAPGGPSEWWKTCIHYDELTEQENQDGDEISGTGNSQTSPSEAMKRETLRLRMRSARLEALLHLLKANLGYEKELHETPQNPKKEKEAADVKELGENDDSSSDEDEDEDEEDDTATTKNQKQCLIFLREIRSFGAKPVLRLLAQAMSKFWVSQRTYLGYSGDTSTPPMLLGQEDNPHALALYWTLAQERSEIVEELAKQFAEILRVMREILESPYNTTQIEASSTFAVRRRTRRRGLLEESSKLSNKEIGELLWNSMDLEVRERLPTVKREKRNAKHPVGKSNYVEPGPRESFLVDWIWVLQQSMGKEFAEELSEKVGVDEHFDNLWDL